MHGQKDKAGVDGKGAKHYGHAFPETTVLDACISPTQMSSIDRSIIDHGLSFFLALIGWSLVRMIVPYPGKCYLCVSVS